MLKAIGEYVGGKVLTAVLVATTAAGIIWFYRHPEQLQAIGHVAGQVAIWCGIVLILPWALIFVPRWIARQDANWAGLVAVLGYVVADITAALLLAGVRGHGILTWMVFGFGFLTAAVYNFIVCDYQVTRAEEGESWWS